jgi:hypothetical protein
VLPFRHIGTHQALEEPAVVGDSKMQQFMDYDSFLEDVLLV